MRHDTRACEHCIEVGGLDLDHPQSVSFVCVVSAYCVRAFERERDPLFPGRRLFDDPFGTGEE